MVGVKLLLLLFLHQSSALRWGIAGSGNIANDFVNAVSALPKTDHEVVAVAARKLESAQKFAKEHNIPNALEGYISLAKDPNVDVVYVAVINPYHYEVTKLMLENGKHVLCEKSFTVNSRKTAELLDLAKQKKLFLMEGVWSRCFPAYQELRKILDSGELGKITEVTASMGFDLQNGKRATKELGASVVLDLGVYPLQFQQFVFKGQTPKLSAVGKVNEEGVDTTANTTLTYPGGEIANLKTSSELNLPPEATITGTKGSIKIPYFWSPTKIIKNGVTQEFPLIENSAKFNFPNGAGLAYEAEEVRNCIKDGKLESPKITHAETLQLSKWMDETRKQVGAVEYL